MTLAVTMSTPAPVRRRRRVWPVAATALATFLAVLTLLAYQVRAGRDPALGRAVATVVNGGAALLSQASGAPVTAQHGASAPAVAPLRSHTSGARHGDD